MVMVGVEEVVEVVAVIEAVGAMGEVEVGRWLCPS